MLSPLTSGIPSTNTPPRTLTQVSDIRGRVLCSNCHGENDDAFHFCQWCAAPSPYASKDSDTALLYIDKYAIEQRFAQFTKAVADKPSTRRQDVASLLLEYLLKFRVPGGSVHIHGDGTTQWRSSPPMLARTIFKEEAQRGLRQGL